MALHTVCMLVAVSLDPFQVVKILSLCTNLFPLLFEAHLPITTAAFRCAIVMSALNCKQSRRRSKKQVPKEPQGKKETEEWAVRRGILLIYV